MSLLLGIDTGGTYTDAVLLDRYHRVHASAKALTTHADLAGGIGEVLADVLARADGPIGLVSLSTTLATNALVEGHGSRVGTLLVGQQRDILERGGLGAAIGGDPVDFIAGGHDGTGGERVPLDLVAARAAIRRQASRVSAFAVSAHFATRNPAHERRLQQLIAEMTGLPVSCGHQLSAALDAPRRALTAVLNARLIPLLAELIDALRAMLVARDIRAPLMVVRGDGSLMSAEFAATTPVETILSGPAASLVGARTLGGESDAVVLDIGGTTSDIGVLADGEPRRNLDGAVVGGWRTRVRAVEVYTYGLGGDSAVRFDGDGPFTLGPDRLVPLALLGAATPAVAAVLAQQLAEQPLRQHAGWFALRRRTPTVGSESFSAAQRALWDRLADGPVSLVDLFAEQTRQRALGRLVERGLVALSGFTPSDAAHVLGEHTAWSMDAAVAGADIAARVARERYGRDLGDGRALARRVRRSVTEHAARSVLAASLAPTGLAPDGVLLPPLRRLADQAFNADASYELVDASLHLRRPLIVLGAAATTYGPGIAEHLGTHLVLPAHAEVANAVGAVVAGVVQRVVATITPLPDERYRVHTTAGVSTFRSLDDAGTWAAGEAERLARDQAAAAGAEDVEVDIVRRDTVGHTDMGYEIFFEGTVTATARGRPRTLEHPG